eukprot:TRINITY_DN27451_c0_g1_i1.p1 TRINITY_DN27451_c0_g1~~TRINITY_DN27451_c0_g1_i1.p1  ORF type:complete len:267 (-),score=14.65 TRINITY_DN27451_c0_g1_i1:58-858(-)
MSSNIVFNPRVKLSKIVRSDYPQSQARSGSSRKVTLIPFNHEDHTRDETSLSGVTIVKFPPRNENSLAKLNRTQVSFFGRRAKKEEIAINDRTLPHQRRFKTEENPTHNLPVLHRKRSFKHDEDLLAQKMKGLDYAKRIVASLLRVQRDSVLPTPSSNSDTHIARNLSVIEKEREAQMTLVKGTISSIHGIIPMVDSAIENCMDKEIVDTIMIEVVTEGQKTRNIEIIALLMKTHGKLLLKFKEFNKALVVLKQINTICNLSLIHI